MYESVANRKKKLKNFGAAIQIVANQGVTAFATTLLFLVSDKGYKNTILRTRFTNT
jgi:nitrogen regulatory protein PII-like uncharacterized protein